LPPYHSDMRCAKGSSVAMLDEGHSIGLAELGLGLFPTSTSLAGSDFEYPRKQKTAEAIDPPRAIFHA